MWKSSLSLLPPTIPLLLPELKLVAQWYFYFQICIYIEPKTNYNKVKPKRNPRQKMLKREVLYMSTKQDRQPVHSHVIVPAYNGEIFNFHFSEARIEPPLCQSNSENPQLQTIKCNLQVLCTAK